MCSRLWRLFHVTQDGQSAAIAKADSMEMLGGGALVFLASHDAYVRGILQSSYEIRQCSRRGPRHKVSAYNDPFQEVVQCRRIKRS